MHSMMLCSRRSPPMKFYMNILLLTFIIALSGFSFTFASSETYGYQRDASSLAQSPPTIATVVITLGDPVRKDSVPFNTPVRAMEFNASLDISIAHISPAFGGSAITLSNGTVLIPAYFYMLSGLIPNPSGFRNGKLSSLPTPDAHLRLRDYLIPQEHNFLRPLRRLLLLL